jgi:hypothetical protein
MLSDSFLRYSKEPEIDTCGKRKEVVWSGTVVYVEAGGGAGPVMRMFRG